jgi:hypothetical protein
MKDKLSLESLEEEGAQFLWYFKKASKVSKEKR